MIILITISEGLHSGVYDGSVIAPQFNLNIVSATFFVKNKNNFLVRMFIIILKFYDSFLNKSCKRVCIHRTFLNIYVVRAIFTNCDNSIQLISPTISKSIVLLSSFCPAVSLNRRVLNMKLIHIN